MSTKDLIASLVALLLLGGAAADRISVLPPPGSGQYHQRVHAAAASLSPDFGDWTSVEVPIPAEASRLLRPNVVISRGYVNNAMGLRVSFLLIQCTDVRDMVSHYPPICYPYRGLSLVKQNVQSFQDGGLTMPATEYQFESGTLNSPDMTVVENFMILPIGRITANMDQVKEQLRLRSRYFGAGQVQIMFESGATEQLRHRVAQDFISHYQPLIDAIRAGVQ